MLCLTPPPSGRVIGRCTVITSEKEIRKWRLVEDTPVAVLVRFETDAAGKRERAMLWALRGEKKLATSQVCMCRFRPPKALFAVSPSTLYLFVCHCHKGVAHHLFSVLPNLNCVLPLGLRALLPGTIIGLRTASARRRSA